MTGEIFSADFSLWTCAWQSTIFVAVGLLGSFFLRRRASRAHQVLLLSMIAAVIVPPMSMLVKHYELGVFVPEPPVLESPGEDPFSWGGPQATGVVGAEEPDREPDRLGRNFPPPVAGSQAVAFPWRLALLYGWLAASLILVSRLVVTFALGVRLLNRAKPLECEKIEHDLNLAKARLGISKDVKIYASGKIHSPVIWCWRRRPILLVSRAAGGLSNSIDWTGVLSHELAHWKRRDHVCGLLAELVVCILPWHPLLWWAKLRLIALSEQACDDWVVATGQSSADYAESLLDLTPEGQMAFVPAVVSTRKGLSNRVRRILKDHCGNPRTGPMWALAVGILAACLSVGVALAQTRPAEPQAAAEHRNKPAKTLHEAAADGEIEQVKSLIAKGAGVNAKDQEGDTALNLAVLNGHEDVVEFLLSKGADIQARRKNGATPLHEAAWHGRKEIAELLIAKGADLNAWQTQVGYTPLDSAVDAGQKEMVEFLIDKGVNINAKDKRGRTALHRAAYEGHADIVKLLLDHNADINAKDTNQGTPLHRAAMKANSKTIELLLSKGADISAKDRQGCTPLFAAMTSTGPGRKEVVELLVAKGAKVSDFHLAAYRGDIEKLKKCLEEGVSVDTPGDCDTTALHLAANSGKKNIVEFLIGKGANVDAKAWGWTPLLYAASHNYEDIADLLLAKGANVEAKDQRGYTLLHYAIWEQDENAVKLLISKGANVNIQDEGGYTPLYWAAMQDSKDLVELLTAKGATAVATIHLAAGAGDLDKVKKFIEQGTHVDAKDKAGLTALQWAIMQDHRDIAAFLIDNGADINVRDKRGQTPLHQTCLRGNKDMAEFLIAKGANINTTADTWQSTPLIAAIRNGHKDIAKLLIAKGAEVNARGRGDYTALHRAAMNRAGMPNSAAIMELLLARGADIEARQEHGATPLACATYDGNVETATFLIEHGANIEAKTRYGDTPLFRAVTQGHMDMAELLLSKGADIHAKQEEEGGFNLVHMAMINNQDDMVRFLVDKGLKTPPFHVAAYLGELTKVKRYLANGADINQKDKGGLTPLHCAVAGRRTDVVEYLISKGADIHARCIDNSTPLGFADTADMAAFLLGKGADVNLRTKNGTPLHWAVNRNNHLGDKAMVELFLKHGADVNAKAANTSVGWEGWSAFHVACRNGNVAIVEMLISKGADVNAKTYKGYTPLSIAKEKGHKQIVELLRKHGARE